MATNRYTQLSTSSFNPLSLQEVMMVPLARQEQHLKQQAVIDGMGINLNRLNVDDPYYQEKVNAIKSQQEKYADELMNKGTSRTLARNLVNLGRERQNFLDNEGKNIEAQYNAYQANVEELKKMYQAGKISADKYQRGLQHSLQQYTNSGGVAKGAIYSPFAATQDTDYYDRAEKTAIAIAKNPKKIEQLAGLQLTPDGSMYIDIETGREYTPKDAIKLGVMNALFNDQAIMSDLQQRQQLGMLGGQSVRGLINGIAQNLESVFSVDNRTIDRSLVGNKGFKHPDDETTGNPYSNFNRMVSPTRFIETPSKDEAIEIGEAILENKDKEPEPKLVTSQATGYNPILGTSLHSASTSKPSKYTVDDIPETERNSFKETAKGLKKKGLIDSDDISNRDVLEKVVEYEKRFRKRDASLNLVPDFSGGVGHYSSGIDSKDYGAALRHVQTYKDNAKYMDPKTGKVLNWDQMTDIYNAKDIKAIKGYIDVDNDLYKTISNKNSDSRKEWVSPEVVTLIDNDGNEIGSFLKTRDDGAMLHPRYQADIKLNEELFSKTKDRPLLPQEVNIFGKKMEATYLPPEEANGVLNVMAQRYLKPGGNIKNDEDFYQHVSSKEILMFRDLNNSLNGDSTRGGVYEFRNEDGSIIYENKQGAQDWYYTKNGITNY